MEIHVNESWTVEAREAARYCTDGSNGPEPVLSPLTECVFNIPLLDNSYNGTEVKQVGGEDGGGQESPHRRQNILHNTPKNHIP